MDIFPLRWLSNSNTFTVIESLHCKPIKSCFSTNRVKREEREKRGEEGEREGGRERGREGREEERGRGGREEREREKERVSFISSSWTCMVKCFT